MDDQLMSNFTDTKDNYAKISDTDEQDQTLLHEYSKQYISLKSTVCVEDQAFERNPS